jgi:hypothetical protein
LKVFIALSVEVKTTAAAPSVIKEQSCNRRGGAIIGLLPLPVSGKLSIASAVVLNDFYLVNYQLQNEREDSESHFYS